MEDERRVKNIILILLIIVISVVGAMIWANGGYQKDSFLSLGEVFEVPKEALSIGTEVCRYDEKEKGFAIQADVVELYFDVNSKNNDWNYCIVDIKEKSYLPFSAKFDFLAEDQEVLFTNSVSLRTGRNYLKTPIHGTVKTIRMTIYNGIGTRIRIKGIQLRQKYFDMENFMRKSVIIFLVCLTGYIVISARRRIDWYLVVEVLQNFFIFMGNVWGRKIVKIFDRKRRNKLQTACFTIIFILTITMNVISGNDYTVSGQYWMLCFGALLLFTGILSFRKPLKKQNWRTETCLVCVLLWEMTALSDLFVSKSTPYVGYVMSICGGFLIFVWWSEGNYKDAFYRMLRGLEWTLPIIVVYCMIFRSKKVGILYNGCFLQRESMSMYALALFIAFLLDGKRFICQKNFDWKKLFVIGVGSAISAFFLYYSDTIWCNLSAFIALLMWSVDLILQRSLWRKNVSKLAITGFVLLLYSAILIIGIKYLIKELPGSLGTDIEYENEVWETKLSEDLIYAIELEQPGWLDKVTRGNQLERKELWRIYVQKLNFIGHADNLKVEESYMNPSNGVLQIAYRYGVLIWVPYFALLIGSVYSVWKQRDFLWSAIVFSFLIGSLFGDLEIPYAQPLWFMFYFGIGQFFRKDNKAGELEKK